MFVQVIQAKTKDAEALKQRMDVWESEVKSSVTGFLGSTGGVADDGTFILAARFESRDAAQANSDRPEQSSWWDETSSLLDDTEFYDCEDVDEFGGGGSDDAGFVQVIQGYTKDKAKMKEMGKEMDEDASLRDRRPDVIGGFVAWGPDDGFSQFVYFTSEAEARANEEKSADDGPDWGDQVRDIRFIDLKQPWLTAP